MIRVARTCVIAAALTFLTGVPSCASAPAARQQPETDSVPITPLSPAAAPQSPPARMTWPRTFTNAGNTLVMYQPQVDGWDAYAKLRFRAAVAVTPAGASKAEYGVVAGRADTIVDHDARTVLMTNIDVAVRFPGTTGGQADGLKAMVRQCLPSLDYLDISLDQILAYMHGKTKVVTADVNLDPPPIFYSDVPAILVIYLGPPQFKPIKDTHLMFAVNTNWVVMMDMLTSQYYLLDGDSWLTSSDPLNGPWTAAGSLPAELSKLPEGGNWEEVRKHIPGTPIGSVPRVLASPEPAELIITQGAPDYTPIPGTRLMYVSNPDMPLFLDLMDSNYYYLVAGRWFRAPDVTGPWSAASANLPVEFARIPPDGPMGFVLASVPRTQEAEDAILLASIPHTATVNIAQAKVDVTYDGTPKFITIQGTPMTYAVNTTYQVVFASGEYYCCYGGIWFVSPVATGPWAVCTSVPAVIYTIPPACPLYNTTYVQVYSYTPTTVVVGYTAGYSGQYVAATGALMFGAGMVTGAILASDSDCWHGCSPCYYSYGCGAHYSYAYGGYYRSTGSCYGPHGGAGWGSQYNGATGTWSRAGYAYGPSGAHWGAQAYNPFTDTAGAHVGGTNGYKSRGATTVSQGNQWASAEHQSNARGSAGWAENSSGQWAQGVHSNATNSSLAKTSNGDVYAGHDGNVYKQSDGQWQKYQGNGNWQDTSWSKPTASTPHTSSADAQSSWQSSMQNRSQSSSTDSWKSQSSGSDWKSGWENGGGFGGSDQGGWGQHDTQQSLNQDSWARDQGGSNAFSSWQSRGDSGGGGEGRWGGGGGGWGGGGGGWGGGGRWGGGGGFGRR